MVLGAPALAEGCLGEGGGEVKWLPLHRFEIISPLPPAEAMRILEGHVEPEKWFRWRWPSSANDDKFEGSLTADGFQIRRVIGYRNSFLPVVDGSIQQGAGGSRIQVRMRPFVFVFIFIALWTLGVSGALAGPTWPVGVLMLMFMYALTMGAFWFEASKQEKVLRRILRDTSATMPKLVS